MNPEETLVLEIVEDVMRRADASDAPLYVLGIVVSHLFATGMHALATQTEDPALMERWSTTVFESIAIALKAEGIDVSFTNGVRRVR